jgi:hypothetical protein
MPWGAVIGAAVSLYGASQQNKATDKGAKAQEHASQAAIDEQRRQFDLTRGDMAPWLQAGTNALGLQNNFLNGDFSGFQNSPDYKYALQEGIGSLDHSAAAHGGLFGGGHTRDLTRFATGLATQNANGYWDKIAGMSNTGNSTGTNLGQFGANMATRIGDQYNNMGQARQSAYQQRADTNAQLAGSLGNLYGQYFGKGGSGGWGGI